MKAKRKQANPVAAEFTKEYFKMKIKEYMQEGQRLNSQRTEGSNNILLCDYCGSTGGLN